MAADNAESEEKRRGHAGAKAAIPEDVILRTLAELAREVPAPLWLFGGVAVDFLAGRWTRPHGDIDLNALADARGAITGAMKRLGYVGKGDGWLTHWRRAGEPQVVEIVFLERKPGGAGVSEVELVICAGDGVGVPGRYPMVNGHLDVERFATLGGVSFRVSSPEGEWLARARAAEADVVGGRVIEPKLEADRVLLETLVPEAVRRTLLATREGT